MKEEFVKLSVAPGIYILYLCTYIVEYIAQRQNVKYSIGHSAFHKTQRRHNAGQKQRPNGDSIETLCPTPSADDAHWPSNAMAFDPKERHLLCAGVFAAH